MIWATLDTTCPSALVLSLPVSVQWPLPTCVRGVASFAEPARVVQANMKNPKTSRDIVILQAKLRDLQNVVSVSDQAVVEVQQVLGTPATFRAKLSCISFAFFSLYIS